MKPDNKHSQWLAFAAVGTGVFMSTLDGSIVNLALPALMADLKVSLETIRWVVMIYLLTITSLLLTFGRLSDITGRRRVYCLGLMIFSAGSAFCAAAGSALFLIAARSFQGIGAAMIMACSPALLVDNFPVSERGKALGMLGTVVAVGLSAGPVCGGIILKYFTWRMIFYINIPIGFTTALIAFRIIRRQTLQSAAPERFDWPGAILFAVVFCSFLTLISRIEAWGIWHAKSISLAVIFILSTIQLIRTEISSAYPIFDPSLFKIRLFTLPLLSAIILFCCLYTTIFLMPFYLVHPAGFTMDVAGYIMMIPFVFLFFVSPAAGAASDRIGSRVLCTSGMLVLMCSMWFLSRLTPEHSIYSIAWRLALTGTGTAVFLSPNSAVAMSAVPARRRGVAAGTVATARNLGMVLGVAFSSLVFNSAFNRLGGEGGLKVYHESVAVYFMAAFQYTLAASAVLAGVGVIVAFMRGPDSRCKYQ